MAIARVKTWSASEVLTASDLNSEFNNILDNALSLISPLTADLSFGGNRLTTLHAGTVGSPSVTFTGDADTGMWRSGADTIDFSVGALRVLQLAAVASAVNYVKITHSSTGNSVQIDAVGSDSNVGLALTSQAAGPAMLRSPSGAVVLRAALTDMLVVNGVTSVDLGTNKPLQLGAVSGTPVQHGAYRESVVRGWLKVTVSGGTPTAQVSFNVTSITDAGTGLLLVTWDRDFSSTHYVAVVTLQGNVTLTGTVDSVSSPPATGTTQFISVNEADAAEDPAGYHIIAIGAQ